MTVEENKRKAPSPVSSHLANEGDPTRRGEAKTGGGEAGRSGPWKATVIPKYCLPTTLVLVVLHILWILLFNHADCQSGDSYEIYKLLAAGWMVLAAMDAAFCYMGALHIQSNVASMIISISQCVDNIMASNLSSPRHPRVPFLANVLFSLAVMIAACVPIGLHPALYPLEVCHTVEAHEDYYAYIHRAFDLEHIPQALHPFLDYYARLSDELKATQCGNGLTTFDGTTYFSSKSCLHSVIQNGTQQSFPGIIDPTCFTMIDEHAYCFMAQGGGICYCKLGNTSDFYNTTMWLLDDYISPKCDAMFGYDHLLWIKQSESLLSVDPSTMNVTSYGFKYDPKEYNKIACQLASDRMYSAVKFMKAIAMFVGSVFLLAWKRVPSGALSLVVALNVTLRGFETTNWIMDINVFMQAIITVLLKWKKSALQPMTRDMLLWALYGGGSFFSVFFKMSLPVILLLVCGVVLGHSWAVALGLILLVFVDIDYLHPDRYIIPAVIGSSIATLIGKLTSDECRGIFTQYWQRRRRPTGSSYDDLEIATIIASDESVVAVEGVPTIETNDD